MEKIEKDIERRSGEHSLGKVMVIL